MSGVAFDDPNREALGLPPIWTGAGGEDPPPPEGSPVTSPGTHTIAAVRQYVDDHPELADEALSAEQRRGKDARVSLLEWLEGFIANRDDPP